MMTREIFCQTCINNQNLLLLLSQQVDTLEEYEELAKRYPQSCPKCEILVQEKLSNEAKLYRKLDFLSKVQSSPTKSTENEDLTYNGETKSRRYGMLWMVYWICQFGIFFLKSGLLSFEFLELYSKYELINSLLGQSFVMKYQNLIQYLTTIWSNVTSQYSGLEFVTVINPILLIGILKLASIALNYWIGQQQSILAKPVFPKHQILYLIIECCVLNSQYGFIVLVYDIWTLWKTRPRLHRRSRRLNIDVTKTPTKSEKIHHLEEPEPRKKSITDQDLLSGLNTLEISPPRSEKRNIWFNKGASLRSRVSSTILFDSNNPNSKPSAWSSSIKGLERPGMQVGMDTNPNHLNPKMFSFAFGNKARNKPTPNMNTLDLQPDPPKREIIMREQRFFGKEEKTGLEDLFGFKLE